MPNDFGERLVQNHRSTEQNSVAAARGPPSSRERPPPSFARWSRDSALQEAHVALFAPTELGSVERMILRDQVSQKVANHRLHRAELGGGRLWSLRLIVQNH